MYECNSIQGCNTKRSDILLGVAHRDVKAYKGVTHRNVTTYKVSWCLPGVEKTSGK
jgi:hypothetical protein